MESLTTPGKKYKTTLKNCTCPDFIYRQEKINGKCKHMKIHEIKLIEKRQIRQTHKLDKKLNDLMFSLSHKELKQLIAFQEKKRQENEEALK